MAAAGLAAAASLSACTITPLPSITRVPGLTSSMPSPIPLIWPSARLTQPRSIRPPSPSRMVTFWINVGAPG